LFEELALPLAPLFLEQVMSNLVFYSTFDQGVGVLGFEKFWILVFGFMTSSLHFPFASLFAYL